MGALAWTLNHLASPSTMLRLLQVFLVIRYIPTPISRQHRYHSRISQSIFNTIHSQPPSSPDTPSATWTCKAVLEDTHTRTTVSFDLEGHENENELSQRYDPEVSEMLGKGYSSRDEWRRWSSEEDDMEASEEDESPFEFQALEVLLEAICNFLAARTTELESDAYLVLDDLTSKISSHNFNKIRKLKSAMTRLTARVQKARDPLQSMGFYFPKDGSVITAGKVFDEMLDRVLKPINTKRYDAYSVGEREIQRTMRELLNQLDGFASRGVVKAILATTRIESLDPALFQPSLIDRKIEFPLHDIKRRRCIFQIHTSRMTLADDVNLEEFVMNKDEFSRAGIKAIYTKVGLLAL